mmetsp:Transcript_3261/g.10162  ORF Transcript_3261/g.10162 Transcript_3261/m.10162 type:complete len:174 (-) Transcript_3261:125-646(-)
MSLLYGVNLYAKNRPPDGTGRDYMIFMDPGYRMGRDQLGFGSIPRSPVNAPHPMFHKTETRSIMAFDGGWTDVHGKRPRSMGKPAADKEQSSLYRMQGGNQVLMLSRKTLLDSAAATAARGAGAARSASLPSLTAAEQSRRAWRSRETCSSYECWKNKVPAAACSPNSKPASR